MIDFSQPQIGSVSLSTKQRGAVLMQSATTGTVEMVERGPKGDSSYSAFVFTQSSLSSVWMIAHGLGRNPAAISVVDATGEPIVGGQVTYIDVNTLTITFVGVALAGTAYIE